MNNKVKFLRGTSGEYAVAEKDSDTIYFTTDDGKLYIGDKEISGDGSLTIDDTLSDTSTNPRQNKIVKQAIDNKADKTVATTETDGLMSAEDKGKLDNADDTYALKSKYGDTTINVGRKLNTTVGAYSTAEGYQSTASGSGSYAGGYQSTASGICSHAEGYKTTASGDYSHTCGLTTKALHSNEVAYGKYNESNDNTLFSIGDGTADDARHNAFEITTTGGKLHDKDIATTDLIPTIPTSLPANGGNADTVDGVHAWNMHTLAAGGGSHGSGNHLMYCKHNVLGNGKFYIGVTDGYERAVAVNFAENADTVDDIHIHCVNDGTSGSSWFAVFGATNDIRAVDPARAYVGSSGGVTCSLIGTASGCQYSTILAWANAQTTSTFASVVAAAGFPSDAPYQQEALLQVQVDYYHQRKIVTWTRYLGGSNPQIRQRAIFGEAWNDNDWRVVCG